MASASAVSSTAAVAPVKSGPQLARRDEIVESLHGVDVADPYRWLEDVKSDETKAWLATMDSYARSEIEKMPTRAALKKRLKELSYIESVGAPVYRGGRYFFNWRHKDKVYQDPDLIEAMRRRCCCYHQNHCAPK